MIGPVFVDADVIVHRRDARGLGKQVRAEQRREFPRTTRPARAGFQVSQEFHAAVARKATPPASASTARSIAGDLMSWRPASIDPAMLERAWLPRDDHSPPWRDALAAAAQARRCRALPAEDLRHGHEFDEVRVADPFASPDLAPEGVLESPAS